MLAHYDAVVSALSSMALGETFLIEAVGKGEQPPPMPYWLVEPGTGDAGPDMPVCSETESLDLTFRVKAVAGTPRAAMISSRNARRALCPMGRVSSLAVPGRSVTLLHVRHEADYVENVAVTPSLNRAMALSVDTYRLVSSPA